MTKFLIIFYLIIFSLYILFTRQPDFFEGSITPGIVHFIKSSSGKNVPRASFNLAETTYNINAAYPLRNLKEGEDVKIIYEASQPQKAAVYRIWGYWLRWGEILVSVVLLIGLFQISKVITNNPTPEGLMSELEDPRPRRRKYS